MQAMDVRQLLLKTIERIGGRPNPQRSCVEQSGIKPTQVPFIMGRLGGAMLGLPLPPAFDVSNHGTPSTSV
jgi:hypothetical protein